MLDRVKVLDVKNNLKNSMKNNENNSLYLEGAFCLPMSISSLNIKKVHFIDEDEQLSPGSQQQVGMTERQRRDVESLLIATVLGTARQTWSNADPSQCSELGLLLELNTAVFSPACY